MSEYFTIDAEPTDHPDIMELTASERLTLEDEERYATPEAGNEGSAVAQTLFHAVEGIAALTIRDDTLIVQREPGAPWEAMIDDIRDALRDFFL